LLDIGLKVCYNITKMQERLTNNGGGEMKLKEINQRIAEGLMARKEAIGREVKIGFLAYVVEGYEAGKWILSRGSKMYEFTPYNGIEEVER